MEDAIQVVCRVRPLAQRERGHASCLTVDSSSSVITVQSKPLQQQFTFDYVVGEDSSQETIFANVGQPLTDACLQGFNGTILAYGQVRVRLRVRVLKHERVRVHECLLPLRRPIYD